MSDDLKDTKTGEVINFSKAKAKADAKKLEQEAAKKRRFDPKKKSKDAKLKEALEKHGSMSGKANKERFKDKIDITAEKIEE